MKQFCWPIKWSEATNKPVHLYSNATRQIRTNACHNLVFRPSKSPPYPLRLRFSRVFPLTFSAMQIYLLTYLLEVLRKTCHPDSYFCAAYIVLASQFALCKPFWSDYEFNYLLSTLSLSTFSFSLWTISTTCSWILQFFVVFLIDYKNCSKLMD